MSHLRKKYLNADIASQNPTPKTTKTSFINKLRASDTPSTKKSLSMASQLTPKQLSPFSKFTHAICDANPINFFSTLSWTT